MGLRLPDIKKTTGVETPATPSIFAPLQEANARANAMKRVGADATAALNDYAVKETISQTQDATLAVQKAQEEFERTYGSKAEFNAMEIDDPLFMEILQSKGITDVEQNIPAYRIMPEMRAANTKKAVEQFSSGISLKDAQSDFVFKEQKMAHGIYMQDLSRAGKEQEQYMINKTATTVAEELRNENYGGARLAVLTSGIAKPLMDASVLAINHQEQTDTMSGVLLQRDIAQMQLALDAVKDDAAPATAFLSEKERLMYGSQLTTAIGQEKTARGLNNQTEMKLAKEDAGLMVDSVWAGRKVDMAQYEKTYTTIKDKYPVTAREMEWAVKHSNEISQVMRQSPSDQMKTLSSLKGATSGGVEAGYLIQKMSDAIDDGMKKRATDTMEWGATSNVVKLDPIDYESPAALASSLSLRLPKAMTMQSRYGTFTGYLTQNELSEFGSRLENASDPTPYFTAINSALGENAESFYEQLKKFNVGGSAAMAGQIASYGPAYSIVAQNVLEGNRRRKTDPAMKQQIKDDEGKIDSAINAQLGNIYGSNWTAKMKMRDAVIDLYAVTGDIDSALAQATGGIVEFKGSVLQSPIPGMTSRQFGDWVNGIHTDYYKTPEMRAYGMSPLQMKAGIQGGDFRMVGAGRGGMYLETGADPYGRPRRIKGPDGVTDFIFQYNPEADSWGERGDLRDAAAEEEAQRVKAQAAKGVQPPYGQDSLPGSFNEDIVKDMIKRMD